jgi:hypothetical protein
MSLTGSDAAKRRSAVAGRFGLGCFFLIFLGVGLGTAWPFLVAPLIEKSGADRWKATPCTILESRVDSSTSKGSTTYRVAVRYEYEVHGRKYVSERYGFMGSVYSSGRESKEAVVRSLPSGSTSVCYVNPRSPGQAVLDRSLSSDFVIGIVPLAFTLVGAIGLVFAVRAGRKAKDGIGPKPAPRSTSTPAAAGAELKPSTTKAFRFGCVTLFALLWNGITGVFAFQAWASGGDGCAKVFTLPFIAVGLGLIVGVGYCFLALFNPTPRIRVVPGEARLGEEVEVFWETPGRLEKIVRWSIELEAYEEVRYRQGTRTTTEKSSLLTLPVARGDGGAGLRRGAVTLKVPPTAMHTLELSNNKVLWQFKVKGEIPKWPDVGEDLPFKVRPQRPAGDLGLGTPAAAPAPVCDHSSTDRDWMLTLSRTPASYFPGETVEGELIWNFPASAETRIDLRLHHGTEGKGTQDIEVVEQVAVERPTGHRHHPFRFKLPEGPYSFSGKLLTLRWGVEAVVEPGGESRLISFTMSPTGEELGRTEEESAS